jgi:hypothetical protein
MKVDKSFAHCLIVDADQTTFSATKGLPLILVKIDFEELSYCESP